MARIKSRFSLTLIFLATLAFATLVEDKRVSVSSKYQSDDSLEVQAGYHIIYSWPGSKIPQQLYDLSHAGKVGGVIVFTENVNDDLPNQLQQLQDIYKESPGYCGLPLLITTDQEGGEVYRLPGGPKLSAKEIGSSPNPVGEASKAGRVAAAACNDYNVNGNLAPVVDVFRHPGDFDDQYERSYSMDPNIVKNCGSAFIKAQQANGVVATAKHFPGLGAATADQNTDLGPVTLNVPLHDLRTIDELPFKGAIDADVSMVMTSWAVYPALDPDRPAGLSSKWIRGELRNRLGFTKVTISDAVEAGALEAYGTNATRGVLAVQAGIDIALASGRDVSQGLSIYEALLAALESEELSKADFAASTERIKALRSAI